MNAFNGNGNNTVRFFRAIHALFGLLTCVKSGVKKTREVIQKLKDSACMVKRERLRSSPVRFGIIYYETFEQYSIVIVYCLYRNKTNKTMYKEPVILFFSVYCRGGIGSRFFETEPN